MTSSVHYFILKFPSCIFYGNSVYCKTVSETFETNDGKFVCICQIKHKYWSVLEEHAWANTTINDFEWFYWSRLSRWASLSQLLRSMNTTYNYKIPKYISRIHPWKYWRRKWDDSKGPTELLALDDYSWRITECSGEDRHPITITRLWHRFVHSNSTNDHPRPGRLRVTTQPHDGYIRLTHLRDCHRSACYTVQGQFEARRMSDQTIWNRLWEKGLHARRPKVTPSLTRLHQNQWAINLMMIYMWKQICLTTLICCHSFSSLLYTWLTWSHWLWYMGLYITVILSLRIKSKDTSNVHQLNRIAVTNCTL